jgi:putative peptide zinc metalloprotease protein
LVGPVGDGSPGVVAQALTPVRIWVMPDASDLPPLVGATHRPGSPMPVVAVNSGLRPGAPAPDAYPPLAVPPGPPEGPDDQAADRRYENRLWWATVALLVVALVLTAMSFRPGPAWAEMGHDQVLLSVDRGRANAGTGGKANTLEPGDERYVGRGTKIDVPSESAARLTFPGGGVTVLCAGSRVQVGDLAVGGGRHQSPGGTLALQAGRVLADTTGTSGAFRPLALTVTRAQGDVINSGAAWYSVEATTVAVSTGKVSAGGTAVKSTGADLNCGDGLAVSPPSAGEGIQPSQEPLPSLDPSQEPSVAPSPSATTATTEPTVTADPTVTTTPPTEATTTKPPTTKPTTVKPTTAPPKTTPPTTDPTTDPTTAPTTEPTTDPATSAVEASPST